MTIDEIKRRLAIIEGFSYGEDHDCDPAEAHMLEDRLMRDTLRAIANGAENAAELAELALESTKMEFHRWYA